MHMLLMSALASLCLVLPPSRGLERIHNWGLDVISSLTETFLWGQKTRDFVRRLFDAAQNLIVLRA